MSSNNTALILIVMGVSGSGKTTLGKALSKELNIPFFDGDDFHPESNIQKMKQHIPLQDADRRPWLLQLANHLEDCQNKKGAVLACSALKEQYRDWLTSNLVAPQWVCLTGSFESIYKRMEQRKHHFMKSALLQSQFDTLELPAYGIHLSTDITIKQMVMHIKKIIRHE